MLNQSLILIGKSIIFLSKKFNLGSGSTWPGHIALSLNKNFVRGVLSKSKTKTILVAGTNGKTTTVKLIETILKHDGKKVFRNETGANLLNGIASTLIQYCNVVGRLNYDYSVFEVDENSLPLILHEFPPDFLVVLNLFRDQLDRYGETDSIAKKWQTAVKNLPKSITLILNADDPQIAYLGKNTDAKTLYFGLTNDEDNLSAQHASDSLHCPKCGTKLLYKKRFFSHLGEWSCPSCKLTRPNLSPNSFPIYPLSGIYNKYNTNAATLLCIAAGIKKDVIEEGVQRFTPAFGRQEIIEFNGKKTQLFLSKNPTSFNQSIRTIRALHAKNVLLVLNDRIPDGRDVSWIWDVDFEELHDIDNIVISGDRAFDMGLRIKYSASLETENWKLKIEPDLKKAIDDGLKSTQKEHTLYILPTYSAMLEVRKILTGKKIL